MANTTNKKIKYVSFNKEVYYSKSIAKIQLSTEFQKTKYHKMMYQIRKEWGKYIYSFFDNWEEFNGAKRLSGQWFQIDMPRSRTRISSTRQPHNSQYNMNYTDNPSKRDYFVDDSVYFPRDLKYVLFPLRIGFMFEPHRDNWEKFLAMPRDLPKWEIGGNTYSAILKYPDPKRVFTRVADSNPYAWSTCDADQNFANFFVRDHHFQHHDDYLDENMYDFIIRYWKLLVKDPRDKRLLLTRACWDDVLYFFMKNRPERKIVDEMRKELRDSPEGRRVLRIIPDKIRIENQKELKGNPRHSSDLGFERHHIYAYAHNGDGIFNPENKGLPKLSEEERGIKYWADLEPDREFIDGNMILIGKEYRFISSHIKDLKERRANTTDEHKIKLYTVVIKDLEKYLKTNPRDKSVIKFIKYL